MPEPTDGYPPLPCSSIVLRAALKTSWVNEEAGTLSTLAFFRRRGVDDDGLSAPLASRVALEDLASQFNRCKAIASLHVGRVRDVGNYLDVIQDDDAHAIIVGLPFPDEDPATAEYLAGELARQSRICWRSE